MKRFLSSWLIFVLLAAGAVSADTASKEATERMSRDITGRVTKMLNNKASMLAGNLKGSSWKVEVSKLTNLSRLEPCQMGFALEDTRQGKSGRQRVKVRCEGPRNWSVYVAGDIQILAKVLVASEPLSSGSRVGTGSVSLQKRDISDLRRGYLSDLAFLNGKVLKRRMKAGDVLNPGMFEVAQAVNRGDSVQIRAGKNGLIVTMPGKALEDGAAGENIRVRNLSSGKEIVATAQGNGIVSIGF
ncbi:flagellar basal body P-ring formation protein FlgA [Sansalvadorimonas sp. 2012CJ34-2]|uniref:Flagella basal body P-ring formation protein FlgA n=1 Tax=Parendozoicomonas callyspongiae TaxID=2942213 RepID=A0ABT0PFE8_9GAMM|nr:flagellar basal body P-ring formation chaperone FlgA [Sansalvadorimonas sp. 2012CJ34-2]MCL6270107.1 flagellar basal body P-ring formation protein FlgA [Sansalvadorimonas sp. 2012CJ34-2]